MVISSPWASLGRTLATVGFITRLHTDASRPRDKSISVPILLFSFPIRISPKAIPSHNALLSINIFYAAGVIGAIAFLFALTGGSLGKIAGEAVKKQAGVLGGIILILIGVKILVEHVIF